jgi:hypothetical protein
MQKENIKALNAVIKEEVKKLIDDDFDLENQDLEYSLVDSSTYSDNMLIASMSDRGGVYFHTLIKEEVDEYDEDEYEYTRNSDSELQMLAEIIDGVFYDRRG